MKFIYRFKPYALGNEGLYFYYQIYLNVKTIKKKKKSAF